MLFRLRVVLALVFIMALTASFLGLLAQSLAWVEFVPAVLAANLLVVGILVILTAILGRAYCAVLCPLGIFQDIVFWFKKHLRKKHVKFHYRTETTAFERWERSGFGKRLSLWIPAGRKAGD